MRLVQCLYEENGPFVLLKNLTDYVVTANWEDLKAGDILIVWGGSDIHPSLYKKGRSFHSGAGNYPSKRDVIEWTMMQRAKQLKIPIIGICRGAQMLNALEGGYLFQHVHNHGGYHVVETYDAKHLNVNSLHHQMMVPKEGEAEWIAWTTPRSDVYWDMDNEKDHCLQDNPAGRDAEFLYFPKINSFAIQWHPEMMDNNSAPSKYILDFINQKLESVHAI